MNWLQRFGEIFRFREDSRCRHVVTDYATPTLNFEAFSLTLKMNNQAKIVLGCVHIFKSNSCAKLCNFGG